MPLLPDRNHELFAQELAKGTAQLEAYARAGFSRNKANASRLANSDPVKGRVAEIIGNAAAKVEITIERVLTELGKIGFSDIRALFNDNGSLKRVEDLDDTAAAALSSIEVVTKRVPGGDADEVEHVAKIKFWDKRAALVDIGKHLGMFVERHEHTGKDGGAIETMALSETEQARRIAFTLTRGAQPTAH